ncbi:MAG: extracellular solute-binding protein [Bacillota bacterium]
MRRLTAVTALLFVVAVLALTATGYGQSIPLSEDAKNPVTFTIFTTRVTTAPKPDAPVLKEATRRTGVTFNIMTGDKEKLSIMLASKDYPDVIVMPRDDIFYRYLRSGDLVDLKPLLQKHAPTVYKMFGSPVNGNLLDIFSTDDGKLLYLTENYDMLREGERHPEDAMDPDRVQAELPWHNVFYVLFPEAQDVAKKKISNLSEYHDAVKAWKAKHPGQDYYAVTMEKGMGQEMLGSALSMYGYKVNTYGGIYATKDQKKYIYGFKAPEVLPFFKFVNKLYREGLMDPEGPVQTWDQMIQKMSTGKVFSFIGGYYSAYTANDNLLRAEATKNLIYIPQKLVEGGAKQNWQYNAAYTGSAALVVTKKCKDPARFVRFLEWLYSDEGMVLDSWGIEGEDYTINAQGKRDITPEIDQKKKADSMYNTKRGIKFFYRMVNMPTYTSDGQPASARYAPFYSTKAGQDPRDVKVTASPFNWHLDWQGSFWKDYAEVDLFVEAETPAAIAIAKSQAILKDTIAQMVVAKSEAEVEEIYNKAVAKMEGYGISAWEAEIQKQILAKRAKKS